MERFTVNSCFSRDVENIICQFTFDLRSFEELNTIATIAWVNSRNLPVPTSWKKLLDYHGQFKWKTFLSGKHFRPYDGETYIDLAEVKESVKILNWNYVKNQHIVATKFTRFLTKKAIMSALNHWSPFAHSLVFILQRLLCSIEFPKCLNKFDRFQFDKCLIRNPNLLSMYIGPPTHYM